MRIRSHFAAILLLSGCATAPLVAPVRTTSPKVQVPLADQQVLFWSDATRSERFRRMEDYFAGQEVSASKNVRALPQGAPLDPATVSKLDGYVASHNAAGLMILQDGRTRYERYGLGFAPEQRWTSFSVAKSFTSTLLGAAVRDGFIASLSDPVIKYLPQLAGTAYEGVTVEQLASMTSGVRWNEDYTDPNSDVARMLTVSPVTGEPQAVTYARMLKREAPAGERWVYKTLETNLLGDLVSAAVGRSLASYAKDRIVDPAGFAGEMFWMNDLSGQNIAGCCISLRLSDYARMGQFALEGGQSSVPAGWFVRAGAPLSDFGNGYGYGYQWWTYPGASYGAQGIFGQSITIVPDKRLVIAVVSNWPTATGAPLSKARREMLDLVIAAVGR